MKHKAKFFMAVASSELMILIVLFAVRTQLMLIRETRASIPRIHGLSVIRSVDVAGDKLRYTGNPLGFGRLGEFNDNPLYYAELPYSVGPSCLFHSLKRWQAPYTRECLAAQYHVMPGYEPCQIAAPDEGSLRFTALYTVPRARIMGFRFEGNDFAYFCATMEEVVLVTNFFDSSVRTIKLTKYLLDADVLRSSVTREWILDPSSSRLGVIDLDLGSQIMFYGHGILVYNHARDLLLCVDANRVRSYRLENSLMSCMKGRRRSIEIREGCIASDGRAICVGAVNRRNSDDLDVIMCSGVDDEPVKQGVCVGTISCMSSIDHVAVRMGMVGNTLVVQEDPWSGERDIRIRFFRLRYNLGSR